MRRNAVTEVGTAWTWRYTCKIPAHGKLLQEDPKFETNLDDKDRVSKEGRRAEATLKGLVCFMDDFGHHNLKRDKLEGQ